MTPADRTPADLVFAMHRLTWRANRARVRSHTEDRLIERLENDSPATRTLIADHPASVLTKAARRVVKGAKERPARPDVHLTGPVRLRRLDPKTRDALTRTYRWYDLCLRGRLRLSDFHRPHLLTTNAAFLAFGYSGWAASVTHYATDDFSATGRAPEIYRWAYAELAQAPDVRVAAVSQPLLERLGHPEGLLLPNGIEPSEWIEPHAAPSWFADLPSPRLIYVGGLTDRLDIDAVRQAADVVRPGVLVLMGGLSDPALLAPLEDVDNVVVRPFAGRRELAGVLGAADVGLLPHVLNQSTRAMSSLKGYEYLAAGLPVLSTPLPMMAALGPRVVLRPNQAFGSGVVEAVSLGRAPEHERRAFIDANSWRCRHDRLFDLVFEGA